MQKKQAEQAASHNNCKPLQSFKVRDLIYTKDFSSTPLIWIPGTVAKVTGPLSYHIELSDRRIIRRHVDAVRVRRDSADPSPPNDSPLPQDDLYLPTRAPPPAPSVVLPVPLVRCSTHHVRIPTTMDIDFRLPPISERGSVIVHYLNSEH